MKQSNAWKSHELSVAKAFGGTRHHRGDDFSTAAGDIDLPASSPFVIECKYRKNLPLVVMDALAQARKYARTADKIPLAILKQKQTDGAIVCIDMQDFLDLLQVQ